MGKQVSSIRFTGSFDGAVGYVDKQGRIQVRAQAKSYHDANTIAQRKVRTKFLALVGTAVSFKDVLIGLSRYAKDRKLTVRNSFVKLNGGTVTTTVTGDDVRSEVDLEQLTLATGNLPSVSWGSPAFDDPLTVAVSFGANSDVPGASADDNVYIIAVNPGDGRAILSAPVKRSVGNITLTVPNSWNGETVHVFGFAQGFTNANDRVTYDHGWLFGEAEAIELLSKADYSESHYIGHGAIS